MISFLPGEADMSGNARLENNTDELKLLIFRLGKTLFGVNVSRVREVIERTKTISLPYSHEAVEGVFKLRDEVITLVTLGEYFNMIGEETRRGDGAIIVVEFNKNRYGILVDTVEEIKTLTWNDIEPPADFLIGSGAPLTGITKVNEHTILIADFEKITEEILGIKGANDVVGTPENPEWRHDIKIILADDSSLLRKSMTKVLHKFGYDNITICNNGQQAWDTVNRMHFDQKNPADIVISDIEMPLMDGLKLTSKIKENQELRATPVVLFSSLVNKENIEIGRKAGADAQVSKPDSEELIHAIDDCLERAGRMPSISH